MDPDKLLVWTVIFLILFSFRVQTQSSLEHLINYDLMQEDDLIAHWFTDNSFDFDDEFFDGPAIKKFAKVDVVNEQVQSALLVHETDESHEFPKLNLAANNGKIKIEVPTNCFGQRQRALANADQIIIDAFVPQCTVDGYYLTKQCQYFTGFCWCVDKFTGEGINGTLHRTWEKALPCGLSHLDSVHLEPAVTDEEETVYPAIHKIDHDLDPVIYNIRELDENVVTVTFDESLLEAIVETENEIIWYPHPQAQFNKSLNLPNNHNCNTSKPKINPAPRSNFILVTHAKSKFKSKLPSYDTAFITYNAKMKNHLNDSNVCSYFDALEKTNEIKPNPTDVLVEEKLTRLVWEEQRFPQENNCNGNSILHQDGTIECINGDISSEEMNECSQSPTGDEILDVTHSAVCEEFLVCGPVCEQCENHISDTGITEETGKQKTDAATGEEGTNYVLPELLLLYCLVLVCKWRYSRKGAKHKIWLRPNWSKMHRDLQQEFKIHYAFNKTGRLKMKSSSTSHHRHCSSGPPS